MASPAKRSGMAFQQLLQPSAAPTTAGAVAGAAILA
jgi:hypothetical protein